MKECVCNFMIFSLQTWQNPGAKIIFLLFTCNSLATFLFSLEWLGETPFVWLHNCVHIGQSSYVLLWNAFSSRKVANHKSLQLIISFQLSCLLNMYHHCNFVHGKVFAGFDNFPGQNIMQCTDWKIDLYTFASISYHKKLIKKKKKKKEITGQVKINAVK